MLALHEENVPSSLQFDTVDLCGLFHAYTAFWAAVQFSEYGYEESCRTPATQPLPAVSPIPVFQSWFPVLSAAYRVQPPKRLRVLGIVNHEEIGAVRDGDVALQWDREAPVVWHEDDEGFQIVVREHS